MSQVATAAPSRTRAERAGRIDIAVGVALFLPATGSLLPLFDEVRVARIYHDFGPEGSAEAAAIDLRPGGRSLPPRAALAAALGYARAASYAVSAEARQSLIARARQNLDRATAGRPGWADAAVIGCFLNLVEYGPDDSRTKKSLVQSYSAAGYLRQSGTWRVAYAARVWPDLDPATRSHVLNEAVWLATESQGGYRVVADAMRVNGLWPVFEARLSQLKAELAHQRTT